MRRDKATTRRIVGEVVACIDSLIGERLADSKPGHDEDYFSHAHMAENELTEKLLELIEE